MVAVEVADRMCIDNIRLERCGEVLDRLDDFDERYRIEPLIWKIQKIRRIRAEYLGGLARSPTAAQNLVFAL